MGKVVAIVLAAGKSTRMKSELPKVLHPLCGQPILRYVLDALESAGVRRTLVVVGHGADQVRRAFADSPGVEFVLQAEQRGTGHAVMVCQAALAAHAGPVLVIAGDQPMVRAELLASMRSRFESARPAALLATAIVPDPTGLGRIVRDAEGAFERIVEQKDASTAEAKIREINPSFYLFDRARLFAALERVGTENVQGEYYLTDVPGILKAEGETVLAEPIADEIDMWGINHKKHLAGAHALMQQRIQEKLMDAGVSIVDPRSTYIDPRARIGAETVVYPFTVIEGPVEIGVACQLGPFARIGAGCRLADRTTVGSFVELKAEAIT